MRYNVVMNLSVCIIAKNEEKNLRRCLEALSPLRAEIVLVDTGSTDRTCDIAAEYTDRICHFSWTQDFSAARNFAAQQASHDRILAVDCDEYLQDSDPGTLESLLAFRPEEIGMVTRLNPYPADGEMLRMHEQVARFYDRTRTVWRGKIHENLMPIDAQESVRYYEIPLTFYHAGYEEEGTRREKALRDLEMLKRQLAEEGDDPYTFFQLGQCYTVLGEPRPAAEAYQRGLSMDVDPRLTYVQDMLDGYGYALLDQKRYEEALGLEAVRESFEGRADYSFLMGLIYMNNARFDDAIGSFRKATETARFSVEGVNSYRARYNIGVIYEVCGRIPEAIKWYRACGEYEPAKRRLQDLKG